MEKLNKTKKIVEQLLWKRPESRDNDLLLIALVWFNETPDYFRSNPAAKEFLTRLALGKYTNTENITRARRKLQEKNPGLRGSKYAERMARMANIKKDINNE